MKIGILLGSIFLWIGFVGLEAKVSPPSSKESSFKQPSFSPFTAKVLGNKVRLRTSPDLYGAVVCEMNQGDFLLVEEELGDFYVVRAPKSTKVYVHKNYIFEGKVDANRVNIRLRPDLQAPILGQLNLGETISETKECVEDRKWLEISPPSKVRLYISKEYLSYAGGASYLEEVEKRKEKAQHLLQQAISLSEEQQKLPFEQMKPQEAISLYQQIIENYADLKTEVLQAKTYLADLQENYLEKKLVYLSSAQKKEEEIESVIFPPVEKEERQLTSWPIELWKKKNPFLAKHLNPKMKAWMLVEKQLFDQWFAFNPEKNVEDFYLEQKVNAQVLKGVIQAYDPNIQNRPGDYVLRKNGAFVAFLYSTHIDLDQFLGKKVSILVAPRSNHYFAFPAYFVLEADGPT